MAAFADPMDVFQDYHDVFDELLRGNNQASGQATIEQRELSCRLMHRHSDLCEGTDAISSTTPNAPKEARIEPAEQQN